MSISWAGLAEAVEHGSILYLADGSVRLRVVDVRAADCEVDVEIEVGGAVASRQGLNIPGPVDALPAVPEEDLQLLAPRRVDRRRHGRAVVRALAGGRRIRARPHAPAADREDREAAGGRARGGDPRAPPTA